MDEYYTLKGYSARENVSLTTAMEDYLEMIFRLSTKGRVRVGDLSGHIHVKPSSASKMIRILAEHELLTAEKYGLITLTEKGNANGKYLIWRHETVHDFLCALNGTKSEIEEAEKIEHFLRPITLENLSKLTAKLKNGG